MPAITKPTSGRGLTGAALKIQLGSWIRTLRERKGMTQADLAKAVGITYYTAISAIEVGRNVVPPERYAAFAKALDVPCKTFGKEVLRRTNPWAYAMLFSDNPEADIEAINATI